MTTLSLPILLLVLAGLLVVVSFVQRLATRLTLPASVLFAVLGVAIGGAATFVLHAGLTGRIGQAASAIALMPVTSETFLYVLLPALLFQSALTVDVRDVFEDVAPILLLAVVAVLVSTAVIGFSLVPVAGVSLVACLLVASIVATTDTVAVISIFRDVGAPARLCHLVEGESLLNDAAAIVTFTVLLNILIAGEATTASTAALEFVRTFVGGLAVGYVGARLAAAVLPWLQDLRLAQVTLTLALPYLVFIIGEQALGVSGVIAAVTSGLVLGTIAPPRVTPSDWRFLLDIWEQLAYWASSLIFVLAAILVPRELLVNLNGHDLMVLGVMIVAALAGRAFVLFALLPVLSAFRLSQRVEPKFSLVMLWGGLRGAVTLALALAVTENERIKHDHQDVIHFVAVTATGYVLFTLLVQGLTLRPLIRWLGLDRLTPFDEALRTKVLGLSRARVADSVRRIGHEYRLGDDLVAQVAATYDPAPGAPSDPAIAAERDDEQLRLALVALTQRERAIILEHFDARTISGVTVEDLLADVAQLLDRVRTRGPDDYLRAAGQAVGFSRGFRFATLLHRRARMDGPLVDRLAARFERLLVSQIVLEELVPYVDDTLARLVHPRVTPRIHDLLAQRQQMIQSSVEALTAQYSEYAALLEQRFLRRVAIRREDMEYRALFDEHVIGPELYGALERDVRTARAAAHVRPKLDLGLDARALIARVPLFAQLDRKRLDAVARLLRPQFAFPGEQLIAAGEPGDSMYFISSGVVEVHAAGQRILLTRGDFFGEMALVLDQPRQADVVASSYCQLLMLERQDFRQLLRVNRSIRREVDQAVADRAKMNEERGRGDSG